jgi:hypothetical protein
MLNKLHVYTKDGSLPTFTSVEILSSKINQLCSLGIITGNDL